jgi:hypothetical protein
MYCPIPWDESFANGIATTPAAPAITPGPEPPLGVKANLPFDPSISDRPTTPPTKILVHMPNNGDIPTIVPYAIEVGIVAKATVNPDTISVLMSPSAAAGAAGVDVAAANTDDDPLAATGFNLVTACFDCCLNPNDIVTTTNSNNDKNSKFIFVNLFP